MTRPSDADPDVFDLEHPPALGDRLPLPGFDLTVRFDEAVDLSEGDERSILALLERAFNGGPSWYSLPVEPLDHLRWKYRAFPGTAQAELLEHGGQVVGMIFGMRRRFLLGGFEVVGRDAVDLAFAPEIQGRGLQSFRSVTMKPLRMLMFPEVAFNWDVTAHPSSWHLRARSSTVALGNYLETHVKVLRPGRLVRQRLRPTARSGAATGSSTRQTAESHATRARRLAARTRLGARFAASLVRPDPRPTVDAGVTIDAIERFDERATAFAAEAATSYDFIQVRDAAYLNWRYCDPRGGPFIVRGAWSSGQLVGFAALRVVEREVILGDLLVLPGRTDVVEHLLGDAIAIARSRGTSVMRAWLPRHHPYRVSLNDAGFVPIPAVVGLGYDRWWGDSSALALLGRPEARVHIMIADTDHM